jgi:hypothetical protein
VAAIRVQQADYHLHTIQHRHDQKLRVQLEEWALQPLSNPHLCCKLVQLLILILHVVAQRLGAVRARGAIQ